MPKREAEVHRGNRGRAGEIEMEGEGEMCRRALRQSEETSAFQGTGKLPTGSICNTGALCITEQLVEIPPDFQPS